MERIGLGKSGYHIATSENGWSNNYLGMDWFRLHFNIHTKPSKGEFRMLIVDGHDSHITSEAIRFCMREKIILLCLPPHATHLLQPADVGCFGPVASKYKATITLAYNFGATFNIDKCQFLEHWHASRVVAYSVHNIRSAWRKSGILQDGKDGRQHVLDILTPLQETTKLLSPNQLSPKPISQVLPSRNTRSKRNNSSSPPTATALLFNFNELKTPHNLVAIQTITNFVGQNIDDPFMPVRDLLFALEKVSKAAGNAFIDSKITSSLNEDLVDAAKKKKRRKNINREDGVEGSYARVCGNEVLTKRGVWASTKYQDEVLATFSSAAFGSAFQCVITKKDILQRKEQQKSKAKRNRNRNKSPTKSPTKTPTKRTVKPALKLPPPTTPNFIDLTLPDLQNTALSVAHLSPHQPQRRRLAPSDSCRE